MSKPEIPLKQPIVDEYEPGTYAWCACGKSSKQPFCDGSHKGTEFNPIIEKIQEKKKLAWCGCKHSSKKPFCDGSHKNL
ncbi:MAG: CDGSH iron-sulfur domain-containing protein [Bacteroidia bacterium]|nr:CDGSH iron-sulfur domain-containing protein [Bacteroidia bacterium]NNC86463.1 CDGSH iron-sulfur domain-containing protein [Bacteroidia bacterium]NNM15011.1 CDGSH iron-sulfur domain-containing protein [Bacteroidia bacterium]